MTARCLLIILAGLAAGIATLDSGWAAAYAMAAGTLALGIVVFWPKRRTA